MTSIMAPPTIRDCERGNAHEADDLDGVRPVWAQECGERVPTLPESRAEWRGRGVRGMKKCPRQAGGIL